MDDVVDGFEYIRTIASYDTEDLLAYFDSTYVNGIFRARQNGNNVQVRHVLPRFPPNKWNVQKEPLQTSLEHQIFLKDGNHVFRHKLVTLIQREVNEVSTKILQASIGNPPKKFTKRVFITQQEQLKQLYVDYLCDDTDLPDFLSGVGHNIHIGKW